jgi:hypothetical protein
MALLTASAFRPGAFMRRPLVEWRIREHGRKLFADIGSPTRMTINLKAAKTLWHQCSRYFASCR